MISERQYISQEHVKDKIQIIEFILEGAKKTGLEYYVESM